ncbi:hypothetical protein GWK47_034490 [Chionoecetes opilio]|uniref:Uncharacterized protein n=1 Tax=Chionoecetes opilio TaxID=41210 RepID=A0A8J4YUU8_CHIOP|nr:hypothetical protein GWK47_034490 [Chionoecetes opilio]
MDFLTTSHNRPVTTRTMVVTPPEAASRHADVQQVKAENTSKKRSAAEEPTHLQILNFHPVLGQVQTFRRTGDSAPLAPQSFEEQYWMLPGAIFSDL